MHPEFHFCITHGVKLFLCRHRIRIYTKQKRKEYEDKAFAVRFGEEFSNTYSHCIKRSTVSDLELRQPFGARVFLHIVVIHGKELQKLLVFFKKCVWNVI